MSPAEFEGMTLAQMIKEILRRQGRKPLDLKRESGRSFYHLTDEGRQLKRLPTVDSLRELAELLVPDDTPEGTPESELHRSALTRQRRDMAYWLGRAGLVSLGLEPQPLDPEARPPGVESERGRLGCSGESSATNDP